MKTALIVDFDTRRVLFQKIVDSLRLLPSRGDWDLNWGEPFLAVSVDRRIWVRIFYEETLPVSIDKLKHEIERLKPHLAEGSKLCLCLPQSWGLGHAKLAESLDSNVRLWNYSSSENNAVIAHELIRDQSVKLRQNETSEVIVQPVKEGKRAIDYRLSLDEVRELAEMGLELKRRNFSKITD